MRSPRLKQYAVLWAVADYDEYGNPTVSAAAEISCRWEDGKRDIVGPDGSVIAVDAEVFVDQAIAVNSILWKGRLTALPGTPTDLKTVVEYSEVPNSKATHYERSVLVNKYSNTLPTIAD